MTTAAVVVGLAIFTILAPFAIMVEGKGSSGLEISSSDSCGGDYEGTKGTFTSPNYPGNYPDNSDCVWTLLAPPKTRITVTFVDFQTYDSNDYLEFRDGNSSSAHLIRRCSGSSCSEVTSTRNTLYLKFQTNLHTTAQGFELIWFSGLPDVNCYYCGNNLDSEKYDPGCGMDNYDGHFDRSNSWNACYTNVHYDGSHYVERGGTGSYEVEDTCFDTGFSIMCYCMHQWCNNDLCQNCTNTTSSSVSSTLSRTTPTLLPSSTTIKHSSISTTHTPTTYIPSPATSTQLPTISQSPTPAGSLKCYSCIDCDTVNGDTQVETSDEFFSCFTEIELGNRHFVIRGGSPEVHLDGTCHHVERVVYECYCTSNRCNSDAMNELLAII